MSSPNVLELYQSSTPATRTLELVVEQVSTTSSFLNADTLNFTSSVIAVPPIPAPLTVIVVPTPYADPGLVNETVPIPPLASLKMVKTAPVPSALVPVRLV